MFINKKKLDAMLSAHWQEGFETGRKKVVPEVKKVYVKLLTAELNDSLTKKQPGSYLKGMERSIEIIRKGKL
jgi:hypothetical protein